jgi:hypothetical protein
MSHADHPSIQQFVKQDPLYRSYPSAASVALLQFFHYKSPVAVVFL